MKFLIDVYGDINENEIIEAMENAFESQNLCFKILWSEEK